MTTKEQILQILEKWNFPILHEDERAIVFRYQMNFIQINIYNDDDSQAIAVTLAGVFTADEENKFVTAMRTCNQLNYAMLHVKFYIDADNDLIIASEIFLDPDSNMEYTVKKALECVVSGKKQFLRQYKEFEEDTLLLSDLEDPTDEDFEDLEDPEDLPLEYPNNSEDSENSD